MSTTSTPLVRSFTVGETRPATDIYQKKIADYEFHSLKVVSCMESGLFVSLLKST